MPLFRTILFAADLSEHSKEVFHIACSLAHEQMTRLFILLVIEQMTVVEQPVAFGEMGALISLIDGGQARHKALTKRLRELYAPEHSIDVTYHVRDGIAAEEILRMAGENRCDLIVMGTHGRTGLGRLLIGSVAESVLRDAGCPVLVVKVPQGEPAAAASSPAEKVVTIY
jgi:universal stress protein A